MSISIFKNVMLICSKKKQKRRLGAEDKTFKVIKCWEWELWNRFNLLSDSICQTSTEKKNARTNVNFWMLCFMSI